MIFLSMRLHFSNLVFIAVFALFMPVSAVAQLPAWLPGTWQLMTAGHSAHFESWAARNDSLWEGRSYVLTGADTVVDETIVLQKKQGAIWYIPTVRRQSNGQPVPFIATVMKTDRIVFTNKAHDFPTRISYRLIAPDSVLAEISGMEHGKERRIAFPMKRVK